MQSKALELTARVDQLDSKQLVKIRNCAYSYLKSEGEDESWHASLIAELESVLLEQTTLPDSVMDDKANFERDIAQQPECVLEPRPSVDKLRVGNVLDALD